MIKLPLTSMNALPGAQTLSCGQGYLVLSLACAAVMLGLSIVP